MALHTKKSQIAVLLAVEMMCLQFSFCSLLWSWYRMSRGSGAVSQTWSGRTKRVGKIST